MTYRKRVIALMTIDSVIVLTCIYVSYFLIAPTYSIFNPVAIATSFALLISHHLFAQVYKLYKKAWEYASTGELLAILQAVTFSILLAALAQLILSKDIFFRVLAVTWMMHILLIGSSRFSWRLFRDTYFGKRPNKKRTLIITFPLLKSGLS